MKKIKDTEEILNLKQERDTFAEKALFIEIILKELRDKLYNKPKQEYVDTYYENGDDYYHFTNIKGDSIEAFVMTNEEWSRDISFTIEFVNLFSIGGNYKKITKEKFDEVKNELIRRISVEDLR